ncbi:DUF6843 domain-containing protein [Epilithonimonas vandammei]|uniref:DUF6843 domain-containing protein n=1 Tax=Epilithonimonas vandammei TaxID=2487072 RepID=A0A3G8YDB1_9FLAO|nr:hypothetical protein [Epilithonimonas vandammei]AZI38896.1 hypothetical protein EIB74_02495 [Epilithonimonas vandammei]
MTKFKIGLILIIISFIACVINLYLIIFGGIVFIIGCIFILISDTRIKIKIATILIPLILYIPATFLFLMAYNYTSPKIFLIPKNYNGKLRIVYEEKCGQKLRTEDGKEIFEFPKNGILILSEKFNGNINHKYYFVDSKGIKTEIPQANIDKQNLRFPNVSILGAGTMSDKEIKIGVSSDYDIDAVKYTDFFVNQKENDDFDYKKEQKFDSLTFAVVDLCRNK